jgi:hypothetical protein
MTKRLFENRQRERTRRSGPVSNAARKGTFWIRPATIILSALWIPNAFANPSSVGDTAADPSRGALRPTVVGIQSTLDPDTGEAPADDATGGGDTSPTLLFVPAVAVPKSNVRVITSLELQSPSDTHAGFRPGVGGELGLPGSLTLGAGTNWVGGDIGPTTGRTDFNLGLSPYFQARFHIVGSADGQGFQLGTAVIYKFVGFEGDLGEGELAVSLQYRRHRYEVGLEGVIGQDLVDSSHHDGEVHAYALYRFIPELGLGGAGQVRIAVAPPTDAPGSKYDAIGGAIASLTLGRYQVGALAGASTLGLTQGQAGGLGQLFASARF